MIELIKRKRVDKQYSDRPTNLEQLIEKYGLEQIWGYIEELVSNANEINDEKVFIGDPVGSVKMFAGANIPNTWLLCDGSAVSRIAYPELFEAIGTAYGEGDGSTTFNLPDMRGNVPVGLNENDGDFSLLGKRVGEKTHTLTISEMPSHGHKVRYIGNYANGIYGGQAGTSIDKDPDYNNLILAPEGGGQPHNNIQPSLVFNYIIKASSTYGVINKNSNIEVIDNLTSTSITNALSANQGRILNEKIKNYVPEIITGYINRKSFTQSQGWSSINLAPFDSYVSTTNRITLTNNGFKIGSGISKILVSAFCKGINHGAFPGDKTFGITKNGGLIRPPSSESYMTNLQSWCTQEVSPLLVTCSENDIISLIFRRRRNWNRRITRRASYNTDNRIKKYINTLFLNI